MKTFLIILGVCVLSIGFWIFNLTINTTSKVVNSNSIIQNYEWFYDQYNAIQSQEANYLSLPIDATEKTGALMVLNNSISEYNSKSKQITRKLWKAKDLPYQIELKLKETK